MKLTVPIFEERALKLAKEWNKETSITKIDGWNYKLRKTENDIFVIAHPESTLCMRRKGFAIMYTPTWFTVGSIRTWNKYT